MSSYDFVYEVQQLFFQFGSFQSHEGLGGASFVHNSAGLAVPGSWAAGMAGTHAVLTLLAGELSF